MPVSRSLPMIVVLALGLGMPLAGVVATELPPASDSSTANARSASNQTRGKSAPLRIKALGISVRKARPAGVMITEVDPHGPSAVAGLHIGDTITAVQKNVVNGGDDVIRHLKGAKNQVVLLVIHKKQTSLVTVPLPVIQAAEAEQRRSTAP